jgi:hypothetical protein
MSLAIELTVEQQFEIQRATLAIDATSDPVELRELAKNLLKAYHTQQAATKWVMKQQLGIEPIG